MSIWWLVLILAAIGSVGIAFVWIAVRVTKISDTKVVEKTLGENLDKSIENDVKHIFSDDFREELRNRGRLNFEKVINENAMFLQQDLRLTTSQLNDYMKNEITRTLKDEFKKYEESIADAKQLAIDAIQKTNTAIDEQRQILNDQLQKEIAEERSRIIGNFDTNMTDIINHYVLEAVGDQIDLSDQLEYILDNLNEKKAAIIEDIRSGA
jgi:hypothetical protein